MPRIYQCLDCGEPDQLTKAGKCPTCGSDAVTFLIFYPAPELDDTLVEMVSKRTGAFQ